MEKILSSLLKAQTAGVVAPCAPTDEALLDQLTRTHPPDNQTIKHEESECPHGQERRRKYQVEAQVGPRGQIRDQTQDAVPPAEPCKQHREERSCDKSEDRIDAAQFAGC